MEYREFKKSGIKVSSLAFGCMSLQSTVSGNSEIIAEALASGINFFDTADLYEKGENECLLGNALKGHRQEAVISTKVGNRWRNDGSGWDWFPRKEYILSAVNDSLKRLQTDYIDIYLLHGGTIDDPADETIEAFERLAEQGKIRSYGISSIRPNVIRHYVAHSNIAVVMSQYSLLDRRPEESVIPLLQENNIGIMARGVVAGGLLAGKPASAYLGMEEEQVAEILKKLEHSVPPGKTLKETAIRYVMDNPAVTAAVLGIRTPQHLADALAASKTQPLTTPRIESLAQAWEGNFYEQHR